MAKRIFFYSTIFGMLLVGAFFCLKNQTWAAQPYQAQPFNGTSYCVDNTTIPDGSPSNIKDVVSFIEYGKGYQDLSTDETQKVVNLLYNDPVRDSSGLVPCGRQCDDPTTVVNEAVPCNFCHIFVLFHNIVNTLLKWALLLVILFVAWGGFVIMVSGGSTSAGKSIDIAGVGSLLTGGGVTGLRKGKAIIFSALTGYAIMLSAWVIVNIFFSLIGVAAWVGIGNWWQPDCKVDTTPGISVLALQFFVV